MLSMDQIYTELKLIKFIYGECDLFETLEMEFALEEDYLLRERYYELLDETSMLFSACMSPSDNTVQRVLEYSK